MCERHKDIQIAYMQLFKQEDAAKAAKDLLAGGIILARHHAHQ